MLRTLDKIWFWLKDRSIGYNSGYVDGFRAAQEITEAQIIALLKEKNPELSNAGFQLGYTHAIEVVKGNV